MWIYLLVFVSVSQIGRAQVREQSVRSLIVIPESTDQPREGDSVILECRLKTVKPTANSFLWNKTNTTTVELDASGRLLFGPLVNSTGPVYSQNLTINSVYEYDEGSYKCFSNSSTFATAQLAVFKAVEFPMCHPSGPAIVVNGSALSCRALTNTRVLDVGDIGSPFPRHDWSKTTSVEDGWTELTYIATIAENGSGFSCFSFPKDSSESEIALHCRIGPLTVTPTSEGGISASDIAGIVVGCVVLLILIALHVLCCRCNPRKWRQTKSYILDVGNSLGFSNHRTDQASDEQIAVESNGSPGVANDLQTSKTFESEERVSRSVSPDLIETDSGKKTATAGNVYGECTESSKKNQLKPAITRDIHKVGDKNDRSRTDGDNMTVGTDTSGTCEVNETGPAVFYANLGKLPEGCGEETDVGGKPGKAKRFVSNRTNIAAGLATRDVDQASTTTYNQNKHNPSVIYAKVNKQAKGTPATEDVQGSSQAGKISKKVRRFAFHRKGKVDKVASSPKHQPVLVYAELDLHKSEGADVRPSKEPKTVYAEILKPEFK